MTMRDFHHVGAVQAIQEKMTGVFCLASGVFFPRRFLSGIPNLGETSFVNRSCVNAAVRCIIS